MTDSNSNNPSKSTRKQKSKFPGCQYHGNNANYWCKKIRGKRVFFEQIKDDLAALKAIMGHTFNERDMSARYRQAIDDSRLRKAVSVVHEYIAGSDSLIKKTKSNGAVTEMTYDYQNRPLTTSQFPRVETTLVSTKGVEDSGCDKQTANAITKLAGTQANGGAGITFSTSAPGRASISINSEDEISFSISDAAGRTVMSGKLNNHRGSGATAVNTLATWSCQLHDATSSISGYGTVLVSQSIDALGNSTKTWTDSAGRTLRSVDQLDKVTAVTYDAGGNHTTLLAETRSERNDAA